MEGGDDAGGLQTLQPIVLDNGSLTCRAGYGGGQKPIFLKHLWLEEQMISIQETEEEHLSGKKLKAEKTETKTNQCYWSPLPIHPKTKTIKYGNTDNRL